LNGSAGTAGGKGPLHAERPRGRSSGEHHQPPLNGRPVRQPMALGIRAINALLTVGQGPAPGLFAGRAWAKVCC